MMPEEGGDSEEFMPMMPEESASDDKMITPRLVEGDPVVHLRDPESKYTHIKSTFIKAIFGEPRNMVVLVDVFNSKYTTSTTVNRLTHGKIRKTITELTGERTFNVIPAELAEGVTAQARDLPTIWAIHGLSPECGSELLTRTVISARTSA